MKKIKITVMRMACYKDLMEECGTGIHCQRMGETRRTLRKRLAEYVSLCNDTGSRRHQYLRRMDEEREIGHDFVQRRLPAGQLSAGGDRINT